MIPLYNEQMRESIQMQIKDHMQLEFSGSPFDDKKKKIKISYFWLMSIKINKKVQVTPTL